METLEHYILSSLMKSQIFCGRNVRRYIKSLPTETWRRRVDTAVASFLQQVILGWWMLCSRFLRAVSAAIPSILVAYPSTAGPALVTAALGANGLALWFLLTPNAVEIFGLKGFCGIEDESETSGEGPSCRLKGLSVNLHDLSLLLIRLIQFCSNFFKTWDVLQLLCMKPVCSPCFYKQYYMVVTSN